MSHAVDKLAALLKSANALVTFDSARDQSKPCFCCGATEASRTLEVVGYWSRKVGNRGAAGDEIERPMCAACVVAHASDGLRVVLAVLPHLSNEEARLVDEALRPRCRCGSGAHPRRCELHPGGFDAHCAQLGAEDRERSLMIDLGISKLRDVLVAAFPGTQTAQVVMEATARLLAEGETELTNEEARDG